MPTSVRVLPWVARALWIAVLVLGGGAIDQVLGDGGGAAAVRIAAVTAWVGGVAAMAVPAVSSLTATRALVPASLPAAAVIWIAGASPALAAPLVGASALASMVVLSADVGRAFVQASAYGDEDRHLLRPPIAYLAVAVVAWLVWVGLGVGAAVAAAQGARIAASALAAATLITGALALPRWHRLSRRWLVLVPAGVVLHDHLALAETLMVERRQVAALGLAPVGTDAADLTGPAAGHAVEIRTSPEVTALLGPLAGSRSGTPIRVNKCLVAPTRPGRALTAASDRRLPVGAIV